MRRTAVAIVGLALLGGLLTLGPDSVGHGSRAEAAECLWHRHAKRAVKRVRRHGRLRRVSVARHWWTCDEAPATPIAAPAPTPVPPVPAPPQPEPEAEANTVGVSSFDEPLHFTYELSREAARSGEVTIELNNRGEDPHNLNLRAEGSEERLLEFSNTQPGHQQSATIDLPPGTYHLWCSLPTHEAKGMQATLVVAP